MLVLHWIFRHQWLDCLDRGSHGELPFCCFPSQLCALIQCFLQNEDCSSNTNKTDSTIQPDKLEYALLVYYALVWRDLPETLWLLRYWDSHSRWPFHRSCYNLCYLVTMGVCKKLKDLIEYLRLHLNALLCTHFTQNILEQSLVLASWKTSKAALVVYYY